jgi:hypothetical protein
METVVSEMPSFTGHPVVDTNMDEIGTVTDVLFDDRDMQPRWAVVKTGLMGGEHYGPVDQAYMDEDGRVILPFDKASVKKAPKASSDHVMTPEVEQQVREYFGLAA